MGLERRLVLFETVVAELRNASDMELPGGSHSYALASVQAA
ncbi:hypothetical protein [Rhizobium rhizogenes]|nr:hypothetical protein [Rhizobium rhizogenes]